MAQASFDTTRYRTHLRVLTSYGPRSPGQVGHERALAYLQKTIHQWPAWRLYEFITTTEADGLRYRSLVAIRRGRDARLGWLLSAHYDSVLPSPGALDNASAVALLLEWMRAWQYQVPPVTLVVGFWDGEETGLRGSTDFVQRGSDLDWGLPQAWVGTLSLEMVGWPGGSPVLHSFRYPWFKTVPFGRYTTDRFVMWMFRAARATGFPLKYGDPLLSWPYQWVTRVAPVPFASDDAPFMAQGWPAGFVSDASFTRFYPAYHTSGDVAENADEERVAGYYRWLRALVAQPPPGPLHGSERFLVIGQRVVAGRAFWGLLVGLLGVAVLLVLRAPSPLLPGWLKMVAVVGLVGLTVWKPVHSFQALVPFLVWWVAAAVPYGGIRWPVQVAAALWLWSGPLVLMAASLRFQAFAWGLQTWVLILVLGLLQALLVCCRRF